MQASARNTFLGKITALSSGAVNDDVKIVSVFRNDGNKLLIAGRFARYVVHKAHVALRR